MPADGQHRRVAVEHVMKSIILLIIVTLGSGVTLHACEPTAVFVLSDSGEVRKVSLTTGETLAARDFEAYYTRHIFADPAKGSWVCLEGGRAGNPPLLFFDPESLEPIWEWYPEGVQRSSREQERLDDVMYKGRVLTHPSGSKMYYGAIFHWDSLYVINPVSQETMKSIKECTLLPVGYFATRMEPGETAYYCLVTYGERENYRRRVLNMTTDTVGELIPEDPRYSTGGWAIGTDPHSKGFLISALTAEKGESQVDVLRVSLDDAEFEQVINGIGEQIPIPLHIGRGRTQRTVFTSDGRYVVFRSDPGCLAVFDLAARKAKRVTLDRYADKPGWNFPRGKGPYLLDGWDKMIYPHCESYDSTGTLSSPPWPKARGKQVNLLIIDIATAKVERVIEIPDCGGFRDLAIMGLPRR